MTIDIVPFQARLERFAYSNNIQSITFANIENLENNICKNYSRAMVLAQSFGNNLIALFDSNIFHFHIELIKKHLSNIAYRIYNFLVIEGYNALILPPLFIGNNDEYSNLNKAIAKISGCGWIGDNGFFISPTFGPKMVLCSILTNAPFEFDKEFTANLCSKCNICQKNNLENAIKLCPYGKDKNNAITF